MRFFASIFIALAALLAASNSVSCDIPDHLITSLPGYPNGGQTPSKQYSGMIAVDQAETRFLHYHLVLSENDPAADPLVLWNNGGPGCSSYDAFLFEQGPVRFTQHLDPSSGLPALTDNPNRWNLIASVIYLESPVDVGYSYTTNSSWISNDNTTAIDNFSFLQKFYQGYPEFRHNPLYLAGESYSGMYTPMTADLIRISNAEGKTSIPLKGIMVGNGCIGYSVGSCGSTNQANRFSMDAYFRHMLIPTSMHDEITSECTDWDHPSSRCSALIADAYRVGGTFNIYSVYDDCSNGDAMPNCTSSEWSESVKPAPMTSVRYTSMRAPNPALRPLFKELNLSPLADHRCQDVDPSAYLNPEAVRKALHVPPESVTGPWQLCNNSINYNQNVASLLPGYPQLISAMRVLIYSGDADFCIPFRDSETWTHSLGYPILHHWQPWKIDGSVGGYFVDFDAPGSQFTFLTVKGSGHMVPQFKPVEGFAVFQNFISGNSMKQGMSPKTYLKNKQQNEKTTEL